MMRVLIVEDEKAARERLLSMSLWQQGEYRVCASAANGKEGLRLFQEQKPDIIITDIEMPVMNGLDFIKKVREIDQAIPVIILSCYESFSYAQKAIQLNVQDYLIKDFLAPEVLESTLQTAVPKKNYDHFKHTVNGSIMLLPLLEEKGSHTLDSIRQIFPEGRRFAFLLAHVDNYNKNKSGLSNVVEKIAEGLQLEGNSIISPIGNGDIAILISLDKEDSPREISARIVEYVEHYCARTISIAAPDPFSNLLDIYKSYQAAGDLLRYRIFLGLGKVIVPESVNMIPWLEPSSIDLKLRDMNTALMQDEENIFLEGLKSIFTFNASGMVQYNYIEYVHSSLLAMMFNYIESRHLKTADGGEWELYEVKHVDDYESMEEIHIWLKTRFSKLFELNKKEKESGSDNAHVRKIKRIIETEYNNDLSLEIIADRVGIHKVYLSRLFKSKTGKTCYEYIQQTRIETAKKLLITSKKTKADIAHETGFRSYDHFAVVFKKQTGMTPTDFQNKNR